MTPKKLPKEILLRIFHFLPQQPAYQCLLVCKAWNSIVIEYVYKEITIGEDNIQTFDALLKHNPELLPTLTANGKLVKSLKIANSKSNLWQEKFTQDQMAPFLQFLPHLKKIDLTSADPKIYAYMENILKNNKDNRVLSLLEEISANYSDPEEMALYFRLCYAMRDRLKRLVVQHLMDKMCADDQQRGYQLDFLPHFKSLTHLIVNNRFNRDLSTNTIQSVLTACPHLTHFRLNTNYLVSSTRNTISANLVSSLSSPQNNSQQLGKKLKILDLHVPHISVGHLLDLIPSSGLDTLKLSANGDLFDVWMQDCDQNSLVTLIEKLHVIHYLEMDIRLDLPSYQFRLNDLSGALQRLSLQQRLDNCSSFISSLCKGRKILCRLRLDIYYTKSLHIRPFQAVEKDGKIDVNYSLGLPDRSDVIVVESLLSVLESTKMPVIYSVDIKFHVTDEPQHAMELALEIILSNCPFVTNICVTHQQLQLNASASYQLESNLHKHLSRERTAITPRNYSRFMDSTPTTILENFYTLRLSSYKNSSRQFDHIFSKSLNNIQCVEWKQQMPHINFIGEGAGAGTISQAMSDINVDLTGLGHLKRFKLDYCQLCSPNYRCYFIIVQLDSNGETGGEKTLYYKCNNMGRDDELSVEEITLEEIVSAKSAIEAERDLVIGTVTLRFSSVGQITLYNSSARSTVGIIDIKNLLGHSETSNTTRSSQAEPLDLDIPKGTEAL